MAPNPLTPLSLSREVWEPPPLLSIIPTLFLHQPGGGTLAQPIDSSLFTSTLISPLQIQAGGFGAGVGGRVLGRGGASL